MRPTIVLGAKKTKQNKTKKKTYRRLTTELAEAKLEGREGREGPQLGQASLAPLGEGDCVGILESKLAEDKGAVTGGFEGSFGLVDGEAARGSSVPIVNVS